jgi:hypothetical protein
VGPHSSTVHEHLSRISCKAVAAVSGFWLDSALENSKPDLGSITDLSLSPFSPWEKGRGGGLHPLKKFRMVIGIGFWTSRRLYPSLVIQ